MLGWRVSQRIFRAPDVVHRALGSEVVLLDLASGRYFGLNATGSAFWEALGNEGNSLEQITQVLLSRFDVEEQVLRRDLDSLLVQLSREGLVQLAGEDAVIPSPDRR